MGILSFLFGSESNNRKKRKKSLHEIQEEITSFTDESKPEEELDYAIHLPFKLPASQKIKRGVITTFRQTFMTEKYFVGPIENTTSLAPNESLEISISTTLTQRDERETVDRNEDNKIDKTTEENTNEITDKLKKVARSTTSASVSGGVPVFSGTLSTSDTRESTKEHMDKTVKKMTEEVTKEIKKSTQITTRHTTENIKQDTSRRIIKNSSETKSLSVGIRRVQRVVKVAHQTMKKQMCWVCSIEKGKLKFKHPFIYIKKTDDQKTIMLDGKEIIFPTAPRKQALKNEFIKFGIYDEINCKGMTFEVRQKYNNTSGNYDLTSCILKFDKNDKLKHLLALDRNSMIKWVFKITVHNDGHTQTTTDLIQQYINESNFAFELQPDESYLVKATGLQGGGTKIGSSDRRLDLHISAAILPFYNVSEGILNTLIDYTSSVESYFDKLDEWVTAASISNDDSINPYYATQRPAHDLRKEEATVAIDAIISKYSFEIDSAAPDPVHKEFNDNLLKMLIDYFHLDDIFLLPNTLKNTLDTYSKANRYPVLDRKSHAPLEVAYGWNIQIDGDRLRNEILNSEEVTVVIPIRDDHFEDVDIFFSKLDSNYLLTEEEKGIRAAINTNAASYDKNKGSNYIQTIDTANRILKEHLKNADGKVTKDDQSRGAQAYEKDGTVTKGDESRSSEAPEANDPAFDVTTIYRIQVPVNGYILDVLE